MESPELEQELNAGFLVVQTDQLKDFVRDQFMSKNVTWRIIESELVKEVYLLELITSCFYAFLFLSGLISNLWVSAVIIIVLCRGCGGRLVNILIFILSLALLNFLITLSMPVAIADMITGYWPLPNAFCSIYWILEMLNKTMSSIIVALLTISCFFAVCRPQIKLMYKNSFSALVQLGLAFGLVSWKTYAILYHYDVYYIVQNASANNTLIQFGKKCLFHPSGDEKAETYFAMSAFAIGYVSPVFLILICYSAILRRVYFVRRRQNSGAEFLDRSRVTCTRANRRFCRTAKSVAVLIFFYLITWTPYWCLNVPFYLKKSNEHNSQDTMSNLTSIVIALISHLTPFVNCAFAPLLYTWSNKQIRIWYKNSVR